MSFSEAHSIFICVSNIGTVLESVTNIAKESLIPCEKDPPAAGRREGPDVRLPCAEHSKIFRHTAITRHSSTSSSLMLSGNPSASRDKERVQ